jgi:tRNA U55 pseudouridine synthase TruB
MEEREEKELEREGVRVVLVDKPPGMTPLAAIEQLRRERPEEFPAALVKMGYAGRLDPLARGLLVCLAGPHGAPLSLQKEIESHSKIYEFQVIILIYIFFL